MRGDDGAGHKVAEILRPFLGDRVVTAQSPTQILNHASHDLDILVIVDSAENLSKPGRIHRLKPADLLSEKQTIRTSHTLSLREVISLLSMSEVFRGRLIIYGIEGERFGCGEGLSENVAKACEEVALEIRRMLAQHTR